MDSPDEDNNSDEGVPFQFRTHKQRSERSNEERDSIEDTITHKIYEKSMKGKTLSGFSSYQSMATSILQLLQDRIMGEKKMKSKVITIHYTLSKSKITIQIIIIWK